jgi:hypothetical protein
MSQEADKREHSAKREVDDLTDYQSLNSLGGAGVAGEAKETPKSAAADDAVTVSNSDEPATEVKDGGKFNDGADFSTIDNKGQTNI